MEYINVLNSFQYDRLKFDPNPLIINQSDGVLVSLKKGLNTKSVIDGKTNLIPQKIATFKKSYLSKNSKKLWVDSGGYDLFRYSHINKETLKKYIKYYTAYLEQHYTDYDYIFSLDLPPTNRKANRWFNKGDVLKKWNLYSLKNSIKVLEKNPLLWEKFYFVYQFKTPLLYKIWNELHNELDLGNKIINRAIGGLVSIYNVSRTCTSKNFIRSAVVAPAYNALNDYISGTKHDHDFRLHFLGLNLPYDRFIATLLEKLFSGYLKTVGISKKAVFTYDTSHFSRSATKEIKTTGIFSFDPNRYKNAIRFDNDIRFIPSQRLGDVYAGKPLQYIQRQINDNLTWQEDLDNPGGTEYFFPLLVYSNKSLDRYFDYVIDRNGFMEAIKKSNNLDQLNNALYEIFNSIVPSKEDLTEKYGDYMYEENKRTPLYDIFKSDLVSKIKNSLHEIFLPVRVPFGLTQPI